MKCCLCFRNCEIPDGRAGFCRVRGNLAGDIRPLKPNFVSSLALDPIEKKPLSMFHPGSKILSVGFYGCNMACPFCQNHEISQHADGEGDYLTPEELVDLAVKYKSKGNIGIAYTYNEPLTNIEYVSEAARLCHEAGMINVLVTNGCFNIDEVGETLRLMDAMNVDLKCFSETTYRKLGGDLGTIKKFIEFANSVSHVEITTLIVPALSDSPDEMEEEAKFLASINPDMSLHLTRYYPAYRWKEPPTELETLGRLKEIAERHLPHVFLGNV